jgi:Lrp/AsnC family transcriptional regulator for asnA, asnC and gidA
MREQDQKSEQPRKRPGKSVDADTLAANFESIKAWPIGEWLHRHIDALDWAIIQKLRVNGRTPFEVVAKSLGLNEGTVRKRVKRLVDGDIVQIVALPTPIVAERAFSGLVGIRVARDPTLIAQEIAKWPEATWIGITGGDVSIWAEITAPSRALYLSSMQRISEISGVQSAQSLVYLRPIKLSLVGPIPAKSALALADWR